MRNPLEHVTQFLMSLLLMDLCKLQVCKFLEVSRLSFLPEYGPKLKEDYVTVRHLPNIRHDDDDDDERCCSCGWFSCCYSSWRKVNFLTVVRIQNNMNAAYSTVSIEL